MKQNRKVPKPPRDLRAVIHKKPTVFAVYLILRIVVLLTLVSSIIRGEYENAFCVPAGAVFIYAAAFYPAELWHRAAQHAGDHHPAVYLRFRDPGGTGMLLYYLPQLGFYSAHHHRLFMRGHRLCAY